MTTIHINGLKFTGIAWLCMLKINLNCYCMHKKIKGENRKLRKTTKNNNSTKMLTKIQVEI